MNAVSESAGSENAPGSGREGVVLYTEKLVKVYGGRAVVNGVDIQLRKGEIVGLLGPNGAGKTTSFYMIVGLVRPNSGRVVFNGEEVTGKPMYQRARMGMGYLPQEESIFRKLTVEENILAILETQPLGRKERRARCEELLEQFGITHVAKQVALTLSGGGETPVDHCPIFSDTSESVDVGRAFQRRGSECGGGRAADHCPVA